MPTTPGDLDPAVAAAVRASFARQGLMATLGAHLVQVAPGHVVITAELTPALTQQHGHFHGGVVGAIGDSAGGYAALTLMPVGSEVVTAEYKINFLRAAAGALLRAEGHVVRAGRTLTVGRVDVSCGAAGNLEPCAIILATFFRTSA